MPLPPSLTRQNAFYLEDDQIDSPLDPICAMCYERLVNDVLVRPCQCEQSSEGFLHAHEDCFKDWLIASGYPMRCSHCRTKYTIVVYPPYNKKKRAFCIILLTITLIMLLYFFLHIRHCTTIEVLTKDELLNTNFGDTHHTLKNVPDRLVTPRISRSCLKTSYESVSNHFISLFHCIFIVIISFAVSCFFIIFSPCCGCK